MKTMRKRSLLAIPVLSFFIALMGFKSPDGGEGFEIYVGNRMVLQQYGKELNSVKNLQLDKSSYNSTLNVKYYHCGQIGKNRVITLKDAQNKIVKEWRFADTREVSVSCPVKDIMDLKKGSLVLKLFYSSKELPNGRQLASITGSSAVTTNP